MRSVLAKESVFTALHCTCVVTLDCLSVVSSTSLCPAGSFPSFILSRRAVAGRGTLPHLQSSQVAYRKERLRWLSAGARTWGRGGLEVCSQAAHTPALGKVVLWAVGSKVARGAFPAQVSPHVGSYQVPRPRGQDPEAWSCCGWWPSGEQSPDLATAPGLGGRLSVCAVARVSHSPLSLQERQSRSKQ